MTDIPNTISPEQWPTPWHKIDDIGGIECRQLSLDTYELRSHSHTILVNKEGFDIYRESQEAFEKWCDINDIRGTLREDD